MTTDHHAAHTQTVDEALSSYDVDADSGLSTSTAADRLREHGPNRLRESSGKSVWRILLEQFRSLIVIILVAAAGLAFAFSEITEGIAIVAVILVNAGIGFVTEWRAVRSMEALQKAGQRNVRVRRDGEELEIPSEELVPGDICLLAEGDMLSADLRLVEANSLQVDEAALTGESVAVNKDTEAVPDDTPLADRSDMAFRGTTITQGSGTGLVVATGMNTELGHIAEMAETARAAEQTPMERRLNQLGGRLAWVALGAGGIVAIAGLVAGKPTRIMIETAIALGVAAIPEGLPFVATIGLARGMWLMARRKALIKRLPAVETLGSTDVICTDKTGTLTKNRMVVAAMVTPNAEHELLDHPTAEGDGDQTVQADDPCIQQALEIGALCNNAVIRDKDQDGEIDVRQGDPTEVALLVAAAEKDIDRDELLADYPEEREIAFDSDKMMMATVHENDDGFRSAVKGAPQAVLACCSRLAGEENDQMNDEHREAWDKAARDLAGRGLRVLAMAEKQQNEPDADPYDDLCMVALIGFLDPPRDEVEESLRACREAGIRVVMVTGDQPETAAAIAQSINMVDDDEAGVVTGRELGDLDKQSDADKDRIRQTHVFARVSPEQKLKLLECFQDAGHTVAMTGDGVNDAPALETADIGVAMGQRGTDAARESADMVLKDDAFSSILAAVEQGRVIFSNIRKAAMFMLCTNGAEIFAVGAASLLDLPLPLKPLQILYLNVITDVFPALALSVGKGYPEREMRRPPRSKKEAILGRPQWMAIGGWSVLIGICVLGALLIGARALGLTNAEAVTISFLTLAFAKLWFVLNLRDHESSFLHNDIFNNPWLWLATAACCGLLAAAVYVPGLSTVLDTRPPAMRGWLTILAMSLVPTVIGQVRLVWRARRNQA